MERKGNFTPELFQLVLDQADWPLDTIYFGWSGEPLLNKDLFPMVRMAADRRIKTHTNTNGMLVGRWAAEILDSGLGFIGIDLDGLDQETLAAYRVNAKWDTIVSGVRELVRLRAERRQKTPTISLQLIVMRQTEDRIQEFVELGCDLGADQVFLKSFNVDLGNWMTEEDHKRTAETYLPREQRYSRYLFDGERLQVKPAILKARCPEAHGGMTILQNGDVVLCCIDFKANHIMGNIRQTPLREIWMSRSYQQIRGAVDRRELTLCKTCTFPGASEFNQVIELKGAEAIRTA
jgi:radical SAM protein with 4Fe4S-binding SPASM domain